VTDDELLDHMMTAVAAAVGQYLGGDHATARRTIASATHTRVEQVGMAMALGRAVAIEIVPEGNAVRTDVVIADGANPSRCARDAASLAAATIAAAGNDDIEGGTRAWLAAGPTTQTEALWDLLVLVARCLEERTR
jgi:hypothetical protein